VPEISQFSCMLFLAARQSIPQNCANTWAESPTRER